MSTEPEPVDEFANLRKIVDPRRVLAEVPDPADWTPEQWERLRRIANEPDPSSN